jgi:hypothetical protein
MDEFKQDKAGSRSVTLKQKGFNFAAWKTELQAKLVTKLKESYVLVNFIRKPYCKTLKKNIREEARPSQISKSCLAL